MPDEGAVCLASKTQAIFSLIRSAVFPFKLVSTESGATTTAAAVTQQLTVNIPPASTHPSKALSCLSLVQIGMCDRGVGVSSLGECAHAIFFKLHFSTFSKLSVAEQNQ